MLEGVDRGVITDQNITTSAGARLTSDCLYVSDGRGNERFDFYTQGIPLDRKNPLSKPEHVSLFKTLGKCIERSRCPDGSFYRSISISTSDAMAENSFPLFIVIRFLNLELLQMAKKTN